jgi:hypothetical protein
VKLYGAKMAFKDPRLKVNASSIIEKPLNTDFDGFNEQCFHGFS